MARRPTPRFQRERPSDLRHATPWHRYSHYVKVLPERLEVLAREIPIPAGATVLDYGCADLPYRGFFPEDANYVAADLPGNESASLELNASGTVPLDDASVDVVVSTQVLEHVSNPDLYLSECYRVLGPGGRMLLSTHGIFVYHPDPVDLSRWTCEGLRRVVEDAGFQIDRFEGIFGLAATGIQLVQDALYYRLPPPLRPMLALPMQALIRLADRLTSDESKSLNASVFALIARKP